MFAGEFSPEDWLDAGDFRFFKPGSLPVDAGGLTGSVLYKFCIEL